jgi:hypothetical protein
MLYGDIWIAWLESSNRRGGRSDSLIQNTVVVVARQRLPARLHGYAAGLGDRGAGPASDTGARPAAGERSPRDRMGPEAARGKRDHGANEVAAPLQRR